MVTTVLNGAFYFAYGSNMDYEQMQTRCPNCRFVGIARLPNHRLEFTRWSTIRKGGVADVVPAPAEEVWGVVYELPPGDWETLDRFEGVPHAYERRDNQTVYLSLDSEPGPREKAIQVSTYIAHKQKGWPSPSRAYKEQIVRGADYWKLPPDYIAKLRQIKVQSRSDA